MDINNIQNNYDYDYTIKLYRGECINVMQNNIEDKSVDLILCDLPYNITSCRWDSLIPFSALWQQYKRIIKDDGVIALFGAEPFTSKLILSNIKQFKYNWFWIKNNKSNFANAKKQPLRQTETISIFYKQQPTYNPQGIQPYNKRRKNSVSNGGAIMRDDITQSAGKGVLRTAGYEYTQQYTNYPSHVLYYNLDTHKLHPTQKPIALLEYLIRTYTHEGDTVLDNCLGSGSTGVAAINTQRNFIGIEIDYNYFDVAHNRIAAALSPTPPPDDEQEQEDKYIPRFNLDIYTQQEVAEQQEEDATDGNNAA